MGKEMEKEMMIQSYEQIVNDYDVIEVDLHEFNKKAKFNLASKENKKAFIASMINFFQKEEDFEKMFGFTQ